jgi:hypothetical protein
MKDYKFVHVALVCCSVQANQYVTIVSLDSCLVTYAVMHSVSVYTLQEILSVGCKLCVPHSVLSSMCSGHKDQPAQPCSNEFASGM